MRKSKLRLGLFVAPFHPLNESTTLAYERDLELAEFADKLGIAEIWFGEHHSGGYENSPSPELMIAAASQRTQRIRLGTGVISLPYHNPLMVANRMAQLDHLTRGRLMFGAGPGLLTSDAYMVGTDARKSRDKLDQGLSVITRLLRGEWVTEQTSWYNLRNAHCQVLPCSDPLEICVASAMSPNGGAIAGKYGAGMLCLAATLLAGFNALSVNWDIAEKVAAKNGHPLSRRSLRCATDIHIAETREQAMAEVRDGYEQFRQYMLNQSAHLPDSPAHLSIEQLIERGDAVVGTVEDAIAQIRRLESQVSDFGCLLLFDRNWACTEHKKRSLEMMMRHVLPEINGENVNRVKSYDWLRDEREFFLNVLMEGTKRAFDKHAADQGETKKS